MPYPHISFPVSFPELYKFFIKYQLAPESKRAEEIRNHLGMISSLEPSSFTLVQPLIVALFTESRSCVMAISIFDRLAALMGPTQTKSLLLHPVLQLFDSNDEELLQVLLSVSVARSFIQWFDFINFTEHILELYLDATAMENQKIAAVAFDTIVKLSSELGLAYTSRFILKHLLRLLNKTASAYVLRVLDEFAIRVGESLVIGHFLPFTIMQVSQYNHNLEWILIYFNSG